MLTPGQEATASKRPAYSAHGNSAQSPLQAHEAVQRHRANLDIRPKRPVRRLVGCIKVLGQFLLMGEDQEHGKCITAEVQPAVQG